jgi:acyl carrier protein
MDTTTSGELAQRVLASVLATARDAHGKDVDETLDPIAAGFDSISAIKMASELEEELGVDCTLEDIFDTTSLGELATLLAKRVEAASDR